MVLKKSHLLAGLLMTANMCIVNEVKAMENEYKLLTDSLPQDELKKNKVSSFLLKNENYINFIGTLTLSLANNHFKWWDYNRRVYEEFGCFGLRFGSLVNSFLQIEVNLNLIRGVFWMITGTYHFLPILNEELNSEKNIQDFYTANAVWKYKGGENNIKDSLLLTFFLQGFVSIPLTVNISNFSISISLDAIICELIGKILSARITGKKKRMGQMNEFFKDL